jgi:hypothetical protein
MNGLRNLVTLEKKHTNATSMPCQWLLRPVGSKASAANVLQSLALLYHPQAVDTAESISSAESCRTQVYMQMLKA